MENKMQGMAIFEKRFKKIVAVKLFRKGTYR